MLAPSSPENTRFRHLPSFHTPSPFFFLSLCLILQSSHAYYSRYSIYDPPPSLSLNVCADSVVSVDYMAVLCDSPYTFYYGNGANRNSILCDYGDKATILTTFTVTDNLQEQDTEIYVTMAAYDSDNQFLVGTYPEPLCRDYVGDDCTQAGSYTFTRKLKFGYPMEGNETQFTPTLQMAFSTRADAGLNLGAVNTAVCQEWSDKVEWSRENLQGPVWGMEYGLLIATCGILLALGTWVWSRARENPGFDHLPPYVHNKDASSMMEEMSFMEL